MIYLGNMLQESLGNFACSELNYMDNKIHVWHFYCEERYADFLQGSKCWGGQGLFNTDEILEFNKLNDDTLVIVQHDGIETARYKYVPIFKATMEYKKKNCDGKKENRTLTFTIRKSVYDNKVNLIDTDKNSLDFYDVEAVKRHFKETYGTYKLTEWSIYLG